MEQNCADKKKNQIMKILKREIKKYVSSVHFYVFEEF